MIMYMTWFSERGRELAARIAELSLSVSYGFWQSRYGGHPAVSKIQIRKEETGHFRIFWRRLCTTVSRDFH